MKKNWKIMALGITVLIIIFVINSSRNSGIKAEVLEMLPTDFEKVLREEGKIVSAEEYSLYPSYSGKIVNIAVKEGQKVKSGDFLANLETEELEFQLKELIALEKSLQGEEEDSLKNPYESEINTQQLHILQAEQDLEDAKIDFERIQNLYEAGAVPKSEFEDAKSLYDAALNRLQREQNALTLLHESSGQRDGMKKFYSGKREAVRAQIDLLKNKIQKSKILSPIDGVVGNLNIKKGEAVDTTTPIATVFKDDTYEIEAYVLSEDIMNITLDSKVRLILETSGKDVPFDGTVSSIAPRATEKLSPLGLEEYRIKVTIETQGPKGIKLYPGSNIDVEFTIEKQKDQLILPKTALISYQQGDGVWIVHEGKAKLQPVKTGSENDRDIIIVEGLKKGDLVILDPQLKGLSEEKKIKVNI